MTGTVSSLAWIFIAILFLILFLHSMKLYKNFEEKRKKGDLKVQQIWASNMDDIVEILTEGFKGLAVASMLACVVSIVAALLSIFG
jgi:hypothetical protein